MKGKTVRYYRRSESGVFSCYGSGIVLEEGDKFCRVYKYSETEYINEWLPKRARNAYLEVV
jgi:hypothetical protein